MPSDVINYESMALSWKAAVVVGALTIIGGLFLLFSSRWAMSATFIASGIALVVFALRQIRGIWAKYDEECARLREKYGR